MDSQCAKEGEPPIGADQWDVDSWNNLASEADQGHFATVRPKYERLVTQFPAMGKFWRMYAEHMVRENNDKDDDIIELYNRAVIDAPTSIELWHSFNKYMAARAAKNPGSLPHEAQANAVHERALSSAGLDIKANVLWSQHFNFLMNQATMSDSQRRESLRRLHQRAVRNPMEQLDVFWRNYIEFEKEMGNVSGNKDAMRATVSELQGKNHEARTEWRARSNRRQGITLHALAVPPRTRSKEISQAQSWRRFIAWERSNPHNLGANEVHSRIVHAYECALAPLYRYAAFWIEYADYLHGHLSAKNVRDGSNSGAAGVGTGNGAGAGAGAGGNNKPGGKDTGGKNGANDGANSKAGLRKGGSEALEAALERAVRALPSNVIVHTYANSLYVRIGKGERGVSILETLASKHGTPLAYVHLMRATWKHDGRDAARKTFSRARKDTRAAHPLLYVSAATMEFVLSKDSKIPRNVFEFGLKNFPHNALLTLKFVDWLWGTGDTEYARVILRRVLPKAQGSDDEIRLLWERWVEIEEVFGDAASVDQVLDMWKESGKGRVGGVLQDALRMSRFEALEGMSGEEMVFMGSLDGGADLSMNNGNSGNGGGGGMSGSSGGNNAGNGGGKRDPRTGRRVDKATVSVHMNSNKMNKGKDSYGGMNGNGPGHKNRKNDGDDALKLAKSWLENLASAMPPFAVPMPNDDINALLGKIMETPEAFSDTPAGRSKATLPPVTGKKRKNEEVNNNNNNINTNNSSSQRQDVFRARQAAKQSRLR